MPRVNIFIRKEDWDRWNAIPDVPQWIHNGLIGKSVADKEVKQVRVKTAKVVTAVTMPVPGKARQVIKTPAEAQEAVSIVANLKNDSEQIKDKSYQNCKIHGTPLDVRGKCLQKGCKYA